MNIGKYNVVTSPQVLLFKSSHGFLAMAAANYQPNPRRPSEAFRSSMRRPEDTESVLSERTDLDVVSLISGYCQCF